MIIDGKKFARKLKFKIKKEILYDRKLIDERKTLEELSQKYKISRERVRQIENRAFEKVQKAMLENVIRFVALLKVVVAIGS